MHITNFVFKAIFSAALLSLSTLSLADAAQHDGKNEPSMKHEPMPKIDHSQHAAKEHELHMQKMEQMNHAEHSAHQHMHQQKTAEKQQDKKAEKGDQHAHH